MRLADDHIIQIQDSIRTHIQRGAGKDFPDTPTENQHGFRAVYRLERDHGAGDLDVDVHQRTRTINSVLIVGDGIPEGIRQAIDVLLLHQFIGCKDTGRNVMDVTVIGRIGH